ncbi:MAG: hypothetical protein LBS32_03795 [Clostridiales Family XIII bacterium]|jgi:hypothetical protein|nr:hypothetical protein [Clostridiales Family XIII bacterium]
MKQLIVFTGLLLVFSGFVFYQGDMGRYARAQTSLKALAEECAAGAALYYDEAEYSLGRMVFNQGEGRRYIDRALEAASLSQDIGARSPIACEVSFFDDDTGYGPAGGAYALPGRPSVLVRLSVETEDIFRLPFLSVTRVAREAMYELPGRT